MTKARETVAFNVTRRGIPPGIAPRRAKEKDNAKAKERAKDTRATTIIGAVANPREDMAAGTREV